MKINITCNGKNYTLSFTRKTATEMAKDAANLNEESDVVDNARHLIKHALKAEQPKLEAAEIETVVSYILDNCRVVDDEHGDKGLLTYLNEMVEGCLPKGFTKKAEKNFVVVA